MFDVIPLLQDYGYIGLTLIVFFESGIFFLLPGDSLLFAAGILASKGYIDLPLTILLVVVAAILGNMVGYRIGTYVERFSEHRYLKKIFPKSKIEETHAFFGKYGHRTIILARFVPVVRTFAPIVAGFSKMGYTGFMRSNIIGAVVWGAGLPLLGYLFGGSFPGIEDNLTVISLGIIFVSLLPVLVKWGRRGK